MIADNAEEPPRSGTWDAWLDGYGKTTTDTLAQTVTLKFTGAEDSGYQTSFVVDDTALNVGHSVGN